MYTIDKPAWEVLNATADDWENLEQIQHLVCLDLCDDDNACTQNIGPRKGSLSLEEIADRICQLVEAGLLEGRMGQTGVPVSALDDRSYVWRAWFRMTPEGRARWDTSEWAELAEREQNSVAQVPRGKS